MSEPHVLVSRPIHATPRPKHPQVQRHVIFPFHYAPNEKTVYVAASIPDTPGTLAALLKVLSRRVNLIGTSSYSLGRNVANFVGFGKVLSEAVDAQSLREEIVKATGVSHCQVWESNQGLIVDRFHTGFQGGVGEPYLVFPTGGLSDAFEKIVSTFGSGGSTLLYDLGLDYAKGRAGLYKGMMGPHPESRIGELTAIVTALGYGNSTASFDSDYSALRLTSEECFECSTPSETGRNCSFLRGMAVGIFGPLFGLELVCEETMCRHRGDVYCEFVLKAKDGGLLVR